MTTRYSEIMVYTIILFKEIYASYSTDSKKVEVVKGV